MEITSERHTHKSNGLFICCFQKLPFSIFSAVIYIFIKSNAELQIATNQVEDSEPSTSDESDLLPKVHVQVKTRIYYKALFTDLQGFFPR